MGDRGTTTGPANGGHANSNGRNLKFRGRAGGEVVAHQAEYVFLLNCEQIGGTVRMAAVFTGAHENYAREWCSLLRAINYGDHYVIRSRKPGGSTTISCKGGVVWLRSETRGKLARTRLSVTLPGAQCTDAIYEAAEFANRMCVAERNAGAEALLHANATP